MLKLKLSYQFTVYNQINIILLDCVAIALKHVESCPSRARPTPGADEDELEYDILYYYHTLQCDVI